MQLFENSHPDQDYQTQDYAVERGLVHGRPGRPDEYLAEWRNVVLTTCALDHPHYRIESKTITFVPGRSVVAKRPRLYLGNTYVFTSPMDYVVRIDRRAMKYSISMETIREAMKRLEEYMREA